MARNFRPMANGLQLLLLALIVGACGPGERAMPSGRIDLAAGLRTDRPIDMPAVC